MLRYASPIAEPNDESHTITSTAFFSSGKKVTLKNKLGITGTQADIGGYSFNCHKHIQCGEGGMIVTNNSKIYEKLLFIL